MTWAVLMSFKDFALTPSPKRLWRTSAPSSRKLSGPWAHKSAVTVASTFAGAASTVAEAASAVKKVNFAQVAFFAVENACFLAHLRSGADRPFPCVRACFFGINVLIWRYEE
jgi:hypothetical protein